MKRDDAWKYATRGIDDCEEARGIEEAPDDARLVGWQCGFEPLFIAVWSRTGGPVADDDAVELATALLERRGWFSGDSRDPDYVL